MRKNEAIVVGILVLILVIFISVMMMSRKNKNVNPNEEKPNTQISEDANGALGEYDIDPTDEAYAGKKIYTEGEDLVIENENGGKTIETKKQEQPTDLVATNEETKAKYVISNEKVEINGNRTSIKGTVKNNTSNGHKIVVQSKFYGSDNRVKGSGNIQIDNINAGEEKEFEIVIMGDMTGFTNKITVEFTN